MPSTLPRLVPIKRSSGSVRKDGAYERVKAGAKQQPLNSQMCLVNHRPVPAKM